MKHSIKAAHRTSIRYGLRLWLTLNAILGPVSSIDAATPLLSWQMATLEASRNNAELQSAQESLRALHANVEAARAAYWPQLNASLTAGLTGGDAVNQSLTNPARIDRRSKASDSYGASIEASETIFDGFATQSRVRQALALVLESEQQIKILKARLSYDLKSAYSQMMQAQRSLRLYQDIIKRREENLRLVELRFAGGQENKGAVRLSESYLKQARFEAMQARDNFNVARAKLNRVLGRGDDESYELKDDVPIAEVPGRIDFVSIVRNSPDFKVSEAQEQGAVAELALSRAGFYPKLGLKGSIGRQDDKFFPEDESWSLSLTLTVPLFSGGSDYYANQAAINSLTAAGLNRENTERSLIANLRQAHAEVIQSAEKLKVDISFQEAVTLRAEIARSKYNNGLTTFDDWDLIENDLITRQRSVVASQGSRVVAEAAWEQAQGRGALQ